MTENTHQIASITQAAARRILDAAATAARSTDLPYSIAVVDPAGHLVAFTRLDGAAFQSIQVAQDKAYTAAGFGMPTIGWHDVLQNDAPLAAGAPAIDRFVPFGGGIPIVIDGRVVGGIGVSGGHWSQDAAVAEAGLAALTAVVA